MTGTGSPSVTGTLPTFAPRTSWYLVGLLALLYTFSFVDRLVLGLLTVDIGRDLQISDTQLGLLIGTSFAVVYSLAGMPLAHLLDRGNRKRIIVGGVLLWGGMTVLSGFAPNFGTLAICRAGVALGEAVLTPAAISLIADSFPPEKRILPTSIYAAVAALMTIGGMILGAAALQLAHLMEAGLGMAAWRLVLVMTGLPSVALGLLFATTIQEPERGRYDDPALVGANNATLRAFLAHLRENGGFYLPLYVGGALVTIFLFGIMTWTPTLMIRAHGVDPATAGYSFGLIGMVFGFLGALTWPRLVVLLGRRGWRDPILLAIIGGCILGVPLTIVGPAMPTQTLLLVFMALIILMGCSISTLTPLVIQTYGPPRLRARLMSLVMLSQSLIGYGAGPLVIAMVAKTWPDDGMAFGYALSATALLVMPTATVCYALARRALGRRPLP